MPPAAGVMISKPVDQTVPGGLKHLDEQRFGERNPDILGDEIAAREVGEIQVVHATDRLSVLLDPLKQYRAGIQAQSETTLASARRDGLANVDRCRVLAVSIPLGDPAVAGITPV